MCSDLHENAKRMQLVQEHQEAQALLLPDPRWSSTISTSHFLLPPTLRASDNRKVNSVGTDDIAFANPMSPRLIGDGLLRSR